ncbi:MAG: InlB B-repeat-containing protein, partial [Limisphaerales bacterium]
FKVAATPANGQYGGPIHYQWVLGNTPLIESSHCVGTTNAVLNIANVQTNDAGSYACYVFNNVQSNGVTLNVYSKVATLTVKEYTNPPVVVINPTGTGRVTSSNMNIAGTVTDKGWVTNVSLTQITLDATNILPSDVTYKTNGAHQQMTGNVMWTNAVTLTPGTNAFTATAVDNEGNIGTNKPVRNIYFLVPQELTLATNGLGTIQPTSLGPLGKPLIGVTNVNQGIGYTIKAVPKLPHTFINWTDGDNNPYSGDGASSTNPVLHFVMPGTELTIRANFN